MIASDLQQMINQAMKNKDEVRVSTLKLLSSAIHNAEIDKHREKLTEEEEQAIILFEAKKREEAIEAYEKAGRQELADREKAELQVLREFLPEPLSDEELSTMVDMAIKDTSASSMADFGRVMGTVTKETKGRADGAKVAALVKDRLSK